MNARMDNQIILRDGRRLGYAEFGDLQGQAVFHFHGVPDSRYEGTLPGVHESARRLGIHLILPDRPGIGLSDFKAGRKFLDWPDDICELAEQLGIDRFAVIGVSGGGPYVAACAYKIPERLTKAGIVSGVGPPDSPVNWEQVKKTDDGQAVSIGARAPWLLRILLWYSLRQMRRDPQDFLNKMAATLEAPDRAVLAIPEVRQTAIQMMEGAFQQGARGPAWDYALYGHPWGFQLEDIQAQVSLWHGEADTICPVGMGRYVAEKIPGCQAKFYPNEGHFSLVFNHFEEILRELI